MQGKLFDYAVLHHPKPTKEQNDRGESPKSEVVVAPTTILANGPEQASILAARSIPDAYTDKLDEVEILVRPF